VGVGSFRRPQCCIIITIIIAKPFWTVVLIHCGHGGCRHPSSYEVTFGRPSVQIWEHQVFRGWPGVRHHLTSGFRLVDRSVYIYRAWCAGTSGLSRATWPNSGALHLDRISCIIWWIVFWFQQWCWMDVRTVCAWWLFSVLYIAQCSISSRHTLSQPTRSIVTEEYHSDTSLLRLWKTFLKVSTIDLSLILSKTLIFIISCSTRYPYFILALKPCL